MGFLSQLVTILGPWTWWVVGLLLAGIEVLLPSTYFLWLAIAALLVGTIALLQDIGWQVQLLLFVVFSVASVLIGRRVYGMADDDRSPDPLLNDRSARQVGRTAIIATPIVNGIGEIRLDDGMWRVEGVDMPAGTRVRVASARDGRLRVEPL